MKRCVILPNKRLFIPKKPAVLRIWDEEALEYSEGGGGLISAPPSFLGPTNAVGVAPINFWGLSPHSTAYALGGGKSVSLTDNLSNTFDLVFKTDGTGKLNLTPLTTFPNPPYAINKWYDQVGTCDLDTHFSGTGTFTSTGGPNASLPNGAYAGPGAVSTNPAPVTPPPITYVTVSNLNNSAGAQGVFFITSSVEIEYNVGGASPGVWTLTNGGTGLNASISDSNWHAVQTIITSSNDQYIYFDGSSVGPVNSGVHAGLDGVNSYVLANNQFGGSPTHGSTVLVGVWALQMNNVASVDQTSNMNSILHSNWSF